MDNDYLRVGSFVKQKGKSYWSDPNKVLRVAKRKSRSHYWTNIYSYFVVGVGDAYGHGIWVSKSQVRLLTALEQLAMVADDV